MALSRIFAEFVYQSTAGTETYTFTIVMDQQQNLSVKNIITPTGELTSTLLVPKSVSTDIQTAIGLVEDIVGQTSATNGTVSFAGETTKAVVFASAFANNSYRVVYSVEDFIEVKTINKTTAGFTIETNVTYTGDVGYDVFV